MSFQQLGFIDTSLFTATYLTRHRDKVENGVLRLRDFADDSDTVVDLPIIKDWKNAKSLLHRFRNAAATHFANVPPDLGRVWLEVLPPLSGTPWGAVGGDYAESHIRTRTCLIPCPGAVSHAGGAQAVLPVGAVTGHDPRLLASEANFGEHARVHLIIDVKRPDAPDA